MDAVAVIVSAGGGQQLAREGAAVAWARDALQHVKVIGFSAGAAPLLDKADPSTAGQPADTGVIALDGLAYGGFIDVASCGRV